MIVALNDEKWSLFKTFFPIQKRRRPRLWGDRHILEAIFYILRNGCTWDGLPSNFPPKSTVCDRFRKWCEQGIFEQMRKTIFEVLIENGMSTNIAYIDATFVRGCLGADKIGVTKWGKGSKIMAIVNEGSKLLATIVASASPHELKLLEQTLGDLPCIKNPEILVGDRAYDSDHHDVILQKQNINLVRLIGKTDAEKKRKIKKKLMNTTENAGELNVFLHG